MRGLLLMLALTLALTLAACGMAADMPFAKSNAAPGAGYRAPPVLITALTGLPPDKTAEFSDSFAAAGSARDLTILKGSFARGLVFTGNFADDGQTLAYSFEITGPRGDVLWQLANQEPESPAAISRIAAVAAESLASRLLQLGFAAQAAGLPPPPEGFARPGPGAAQEVDLETLYGPGAGPAVPPAAVTPALMPGAVAIKAIALMAVEGAPGQGNAELRAALKTVLTTAGWTVLDAPRADALSVKGRVGLAPATGGSQTVTLSWQVSLPSGADAGTVKQANQVPAGSLDQSWGETAVYAAEAAAQGLFDLVAKLRERRDSP